MKMKTLNAFVGISMFMFLIPGFAGEKDTLITGLEFEQKKPKTNEFLKNIPTQLIGIRSTKHPPSIDGVLTDRCWENASKIQELKILGSKTLPMENETVIYLTYDNYNLYIGFKCKEKNMKNVHKHGLWREGVEVFIDVNHDHKTAFHFGITPGGDLGQSITEISHSLSPSILKWKGAMEVKTSCGKDSWFVEARVPFSSLDINMPKNGNIWGVCFARSKPGAIYGNWPSLPGAHERGFHAVGHYADLYFAGDKGLQYKIESLSLDAPLGLGANFLNAKIKNLQNKAGKIIVKCGDASSSGKKNNYSGVIELPANNIKEIRLKLPLEDLRQNNKLYLSLIEPSEKKECYQVAYPIVLPQKVLETSFPRKIFYMDEKIALVTLKTAIAVNSLKDFSIRIQLRNEKTNKLIAESKIQYISLPSMSFNLNIANLPSGKYKLSAELVNENGTELSEENFVFEKMVGPFDQSGTGKITTELGVAEKQASDTTSAIKL